VDYNLDTTITSGVLCKHTIGERASLALTRCFSMPLLYLRCNFYIHEQSLKLGTDL